MLVSITASATYEEALERAAERWGVQREYWDIWGKHHRATPEMIAAVLRSLGVDADPARNSTRRWSAKFAPNGSGSYRLHSSRARVRQRSLSVFAQSNRSRLT